MPIWAGCLSQGGGAHTCWAGIRNMQGSGGYVGSGDTDTHGYEYGSEFWDPCILVSVSVDQCLDPWYPCLDKNQSKSHFLGYFL